MKKKHNAVYGPLSVDNEKVQNKNHYKDSWLLYLSAFGACFVAVAVGANIVWISPVLWKLKSNDTNINPLGIPVTTYEVATIAGLIPLGGLCGSIFLNKLCDTIGPKITIMTLSSIMLASTICIAFARHVYIYFLARFIIGVCFGGVIPATSVFLSELSEDHNRGKIGCFLGMGLPIGNLFVYLLGPLFSVQTFTLFCTMPYIINLLCFLIFIPESPIYLAKKGNREKTIKALERIRRKSLSGIEEEYEQIIASVKHSGKNESSWKSVFGVRCNRKGFIIALGLSILQQLSGICAILAFAGPLIDESGSSLSGDMTAILLGMIKMGGCSLASMVIEHSGRRPLLMLSTLGGSIPHIILGLFFVLKHSNPDLITNIQWLPVVCILSFILFYSIGLGVIPTAIMTDLFPSNLKSKSASASSFVSHVSILLVTTSFPIMNDFLGPSWCLWTFALFEILGFFFVYFVVPEIKGKSITEVQELLSR